MYEYRRQRWDGSVRVRVDRETGGNVRVRVETCGIRFLALDLIT